jgi:hypothetical protein
MIIKSSHLLQAGPGLPLLAFRSACSKMGCVVNAGPSSRPAESLSGLIERVTFFNEENGFGVLKVNPKGHRDLVTVVGSLPSANAGEWVTAEERWVQDRAPAGPHQPGAHPHGRAGRGQDHPGQRHARKPKADLIEASIPTEENRVFSGSGRVLACPHRPPT